MPKADHLIAMCSAASTCSEEIQEFKPTDKLMHLGKGQLIFSALIITKQHTGHRQHDSSQLLQYAGYNIDLLPYVAADTYQLDAVELIARSQDPQSALCWLFGDVQSSLKCTSNGSLILHPCDVITHLTNTIRVNSDL